MANLNKGIILYHLTSILQRCKGYADTKVGELASAVQEVMGDVSSSITSLENGKADKATTLAGYGIAEAYTKTEADAKIVELIDANVTINVATDDEVTAVCTAVFGA